MTTNGDSGGWKYGKVHEMVGNRGLFRVIEDGTGRIYEFRNADMLRSMNPWPGLNDKTQFKLKEDGSIETIQCVDKQPVVVDTDSDDEFRYVRGVYAHISRRRE